MLLLSLTTIEAFGTLAPVAGAIREGPPMVEGALAAPSPENTSTQTASSDVCYGGTYLHDGAETERVEIESTR